MRAFSLVELSIVLVILGLLVGGILAGQSLIRAGELRSVSANLQRYQTAMHAFQDKYFSLPGDMTNATKFWGIAAGGTGNDQTCYQTDSTGDARTCNGNGNGEWYLVDNVTDGTAPEWFRTWQHLANSGLVEGNYSGKAVSFPRAAAGGTNVPIGKAQELYTFMSLHNIWYNDPNWTTIFWHGNYRGIMVGRKASVNYTNGPFLTPAEAWSLDTKLDDGIPGKGSLLSTVSSNCNTATGFMAQNTAEYNLSNDILACALFYKL